MGGGARADLASPERAGYYPDKDTPPVRCIDGPRRSEWLDTVYGDTTLITKLMPVPLSRSLRPVIGMTYTSSATHPSLVLDMLEQLDIADGHRVLEIGTGTGYNAALLCDRLDSRYMTSVDIDPELLANDCPQTATPPPLLPSTATRLPTGRPV